MEAINPATGDVVETYEEDGPEEVEAALARATETFDSWRDRPIRERQELLADAAAVLRDDIDEYAETMTTEMGKPIEQARSEVEKCAWVCDHYATHADASGGPARPSGAR